MYGVSTLFANVMFNAVVFLPFNCSEELFVVPIVDTAPSRYDVITTSFGFPVVPINATLFALYENDAAPATYVPGEIKIRFCAAADAPDGTPPLLANAAVRLLYSPVYPFPGAPFVPA
jgi:hypothetical protein